MTYFESIGIDYQYSATNFMSAKKAMSISCHKCATTGKNIVCDRCAIANAHNDVINLLIKH